MVSPRLPAYDPQSVCPMCSAEGGSVVFHPSGFIGWPCWPAAPVQDRVHIPHLCKQCLRCGFGWCEQTASAYADENPEEADMSIRKTATAEGVIGIEDAPGLVKTAAADTHWAAEDEQQLADENAAADELGS